MDPATMGAMMQGAGAIMQGVQAPGAGPSESNLTGTYAFDWDTSGWNVNFGSGGIDSWAQRTKTTTTPTGELIGGGMAAGGDWETLALIGLAGLALWVVLRG